MFCILITGWKVQINKIDFCCKLKEERSFFFKSRNRLIIVTPWSAHCTAHQICCQLYFCSLFCTGNALLLEQVSIQFTTKILYQIRSQFLCCLLHIRNVYCWSKLARDSCTFVKKNKNQAKQSHVVFYQ